MALAIFCRKIGPAVLPYVVALDESYGCHDDPGLFLKYIKTYLNDTNARLAESEESHNRSESHIDDSDEPPDDFEEPPDDFEEPPDDFEEPPDDFEESPDASDEEIEDFDPEESDDTDTYRERFFAARYRATHTLLKTLYDRPTVFVDTPKWNDWFFSKHSPWENEQIACVYHFLEIKFAQASYDVVAHDVEFGVREVDYLTSWQENESRQLWYYAVP
ncbi:hypothetical protein COL940_012755 [Colletotrichum noveboracense]|nr:hypothetical protein COL940_012755 [Colletotrichum noveboracense]